VLWSFFVWQVSFAYCRQSGSLCSRNQLPQKQTTQIQNPVAEFRAVLVHPSFCCISRSCLAVSIYELLNSCKVSFGKMASIFVFCSSSKSVYWSSCVLSLCTSLKFFTKAIRAASPFKVIHFLRFAYQIVFLHKYTQCFYCFLYLSITTGAGSTNQISLAFPLSSPENKAMAWFTAFLLRTEI
jgi:hypothetical protein